MLGKNIQKIIKVGNSLAVTLPTALTRALGIERGDLVVLGCVQDGVIYVRKVTDKDVRDGHVDVIDFNS